MPFTPFHFGPGAALVAVAPRHVSFLAFCAVNGLIDLETLYNLQRQAYPVHGFFHTCIGASIVAAAAVIAFLVARRLGDVLPNLYGWKELTVIQVCVGAVAAACSHVVLDGIMHPDVAPFAPFSRENRLLDAVSLDALHGFCIVTGAAAVVVVVVQNTSMEWALGHARDTHRPTPWARFPRDGEEYEAANDIEVEYVVHFQAPSRSGGKAELSGGTRIRVSVAPEDAEPTGVYAVPLDDGRLEAAVVPSAERTSPKYGGFRVFIPVGELNTQFKLVEAKP